MRMVELPKLTNAQLLRLGKLLEWTMEESGRQAKDGFTEGQKAEALEIWHAANELYDLIFPEDE